jgi:sulfide dehydrogenase cytochrome subunit
MNSQVKSVFILSLLCTAISTVAMADIEKLKKQCAECHEKDGNSKDKDTPRIAGLSAAYIKDSIAAYLDDVRPAQNVKRKDKEDTDMKKIAKELKEDEIDALAKYFSEQKYKSVDQKFDADKAGKGAPLHKKFCAKCHEKEGKSPSDDAGFLGGQHISYMEYSMKNYQDGKREMVKKMEVKWKAMHKKAGDEGIEQLIHYYASQK